MAGPARQRIGRDGDNEKRERAAENRFHSHGEVPLLASGAAALERLAARFPRLRGIARVPPGGESFHQVLLVVGHLRPALSSHVGHTERRPTEVTLDVLVVLAGTERCSPLGVHPEDLVHEILAYLFRRNGAVLRSWDPQRASFRGYLGMIASRFVRRRLGNRLVIISLGDIGLAEVDDADIDDLLAYRAALEEILAWLDARNGDHDRERFNALFIDGRSAADIAAGEGVTADAIYTWKSRLRGRIAKAFPHVVELLRSGARSGKRHGGDES